MKKCFLFFLLAVCASQSFAKVAIVTLDDVREGNFQVSDCDPFTNPILLKREIRQDVLRYDRLIASLEECEISGKATHLRFLKAKREEIRKDAEYQTLYKWKRLLQREKKELVWSGKEFKEIWEKSPWHRFALQRKDERVIAWELLQEVNEHGIVLMDRAGIENISHEQMSLLFQKFMGYETYVQMQLEKKAEEANALRDWDLTEDEPEQKKAVIKKPRRVASALRPKVSFSEVGLKMIKSEYGYVDASWKCKVTNHSVRDGEVFFKLMLYDAEGFVMDYDSASMMVPVGGTKIYTHEISVKQSVWNKCRDYKVIEDEI